jgi:hypothetical protein
MDAELFSEKTVTIYQTTLRHIPEHSSICNQRCNNLNPNTVTICEVNLLYYPEDGCSGFLRKDNLPDWSASYPRRQ